MSTIKEAMCITEPFGFSSISRELKDLAKSYDIPVKTVTAVKPSYSSHYIEQLRSQIADDGHLLDSMRWNMPAILKGREMIRSNPCSEMHFPVSPFGMMIDWDIKEPKPENTNWQFKSSADADINWNDVKDTLSYKEPLALVTRKYRDYDEDSKYVVVDKQLWDKAMAISIEDVPSCLETVAKRVFLIENNFSDWVDWAKAVKSAGWPDGIKSIVNVILPTV